MYKRYINIIIIIIIILSKSLIQSSMTSVFSLNFSSAGKGPFLTGKAKNMH